MGRMALVLVVCLFIATSCTVDPNAGGSSEHGNEFVAGVIRDRDGAPAAGVTVYLLPDEYNPVTDSTRISQRAAVTDSSGFFVFDSCSDGNLYTLRAYDYSTGNGCIMKGVISLPPPSSAPLRGAGPRTIAAAETKGSCTDTLTLDINGSIYFETDSLSLDTGMVVYMPGSPYFSVVEASNIVTFFGIPSGRIALRAYDPVTGEVVNLGDDYLCIEIVPGASLLLPSRSPKPYCLENGSIVDSVRAVVGAVLVFSAVHPAKTLDGNYQYRFWWGDGNTSDWEGVPVREWSWNRPGIYSVQAQVMRRGIYLAWSDPIIIEITAGE